MKKEDFSIPFRNINLSTLKTLTIAQNVPPTMACVIQLYDSNRLDMKRSNLLFIHKSVVHTVDIQQRGGFQMAFCCGASMIGTKGTLKLVNSHIHNVPLLFCPVCQKVDIHYLVEQEYDLLTEYAQGDGMELDFTAFMDPDVTKHLHENCVNSEQEHPIDVVRNQIDMALDLMAVAKEMNDDEWGKQLKHRLNVLSQRHHKLQQKALLQKRK